MEPRLLARQVCPSNVMMELVSRALTTAKLLLHVNEENIYVQMEIVSRNERIVKNRQVAN